MTILLAASLSGALTLLLIVALAVLIIGAIYWLAEQLLPHPWPLVIVAACVIVLLLYLLAGADSVDL